MNNNLKPSVKICSPFMYYCQKVIPLAFDESMSYYEQLCNLVYYLKNTVLPAVNNNADALTEVQNAFNILKQYVDTYFDNLDVQEEINNKLDEMAQSGELAEIIALYIRSNAVLGYKTVADMKNATNLIDGSICKTISKTTVGDNGGRYYIVRTITSSDVVDEINIISLSASDTLIAQLINDNRFLDLQNEKISFCNTVEDLKEKENLNVNNIVRTFGYYDLNDGGSAYYLIQNKDADLINDVTYIELPNNLMATLVIEKEMNCKQFGLVGDGTTDDTAKFNLFLNEDVEVYNILNGTYLIDGNLNINSNSIINFNNNAIIKRKPTTLDVYFMLNIVNKNNVTINNAHLIGDKDEHLSDTGAWGYGINIAYSQNVNINNAIIEETWGDGIYIGNSYQENKTQETKNIIVNKCKILNCSRNGISLCTGENIILTDNYIYGVNRTNPKSGIDIEPEGKDVDTKYLKNIKIINTTTENNGIGISGTTETAIIDNLIIDNHNSINEVEGFVIFNIQSASNIIYKNANIVKCYDAGIIITKKKICDLIIKNITINGFRKQNITHNYDGGIIIRTNSADDGNLIIDNIEMLNTYSDLLLADDIIIERGTGTFDGLTIKNINTRKYLCLNNVTNCNIVNSKFIYNGSYYSISNSKLTIFNLMKNESPLSTTTTRTIGDTIPDGDYEIILNNNTGGYNLQVVFNDNLTVFNTSTYGQTSRTYSCNYRSGYLKFHKTGTIISILINNGFSI